MIRRLYSLSLRSFKDLTFRPGLNVILADKSANASDKQTRNRAGKSSTVELISFLLGGKLDKDNLARNPALAAHWFGLELELGDSFTRVERSGTPRSPIRVAGDFSRWPRAPRQRDDGHEIGLKPWQEVLGELMFGLSPRQGNWNPSFRSLIAYFLRRDASGGFMTPMQQSAKQHLADQQVNISYLLGLDWTVPQAWQRVRDREKGIKTLKKGLKEGAMGHVIDNAASLKTRLVVAQDRARRLEEQVASFEVLPEYHQLEREASTLTQRLAELSNENTLDRRYLSELERTTIEEAPPAPQNLQALYEEAGIVLPDLVQRRYDDVQLFHEAVVRNRRSYLSSEQDAAARRLAERESEMAELDRRRAEVMSILQSKGALEHFAALRSELARAQTDVATLRDRHQTAEAIETNKLRLNVERAELHERLRRDYAEQEDTVNDAILTFESISRALYEDSKSGSLTITPTDNGPRFDIAIQGAKSKGVNNMQIFSFDMMLTLLSLKRGCSPGFLVHDSHLFDGVDERQVAKALSLGASLAKQHGFQYIVTLNTDDVPAHFPPGFSLDDHVLDVTLSDASEDGGLFGFRFN